MTYSLGHCVLCFVSCVILSVCYLDISSGQIDDESGVVESKWAVLNFLYSRQLHSLTLNDTLEFE